MNFIDFKLDARLERAIEAAEYATPTPIQASTIPLGLAGRDIIGTAQTGTGKTAAFVLPMLHRLLQQPARWGKTRALILTPTRELAEQIHSMIQQLGKWTSIRSATIYGGVGMLPQERALRTGVEVLVACPGRLLDHLGRGTAKLDGIDLLVVDEADRMLDMGFLPAVRRILSQLPRERQTMLFSATFAPELETLAAQTLRNPERVNVSLGAPPKTVAHALYPVPQHLKTPLLLQLLRETDARSILIFTRTKHRANRVAEQIERANYSTSVLHSNKSQNQRQLALDGFRSGKFQILVATDIAARGLDIATVSHVINYDIPDTADAYIHRIGRTGRAERDGDALTLVAAEDAPIVRDIERALKQPITRRKLADFDYNAPAPPNAPASMRAPYMPQRVNEQHPSRGRYAAQGASNPRNAAGRRPTLPQGAPRPRQQPKVSGR
ncbi:MAG: DEAD/DEAH box helicase [Herpetosiphonaceae bacterium]|nr:DEAD/DEAH box helicase [Herpetosiphonaceae bacterium]